MLDLVVHRVTTKTERVSVFMTIRERLQCCNNEIWNYVSDVTWNLRMAVKSVSESSRVIGIPQQLHRGITLC